MNEAKALNKKCPYQYNSTLHEFAYCITEGCMAWMKVDEQTGHCRRLFERFENDGMTSGIAGPEIKA